MKSLITREDEVFEILKGLAADNPCEDCGPGTTEAERVASRHWRGIKVRCRLCKAIKAEIDDPEDGWISSQ
jgi:hypothetical protein